MMIFNEVADVSIDEDLHLDYKDDGEFYSIAAIVTFMKRFTESYWFLRGCGSVLFNWRVQISLSGD